MKRSSGWILGLAGFVLVVFLFIRWGKRGNADTSEAKKDRPLTRVDAYVVKPSLLINEISVSGSLLPFEEVDLKSEVAGRVVKINLPEGKFVKAGTLLVKLYDEDLQATLEKLQTQLDIQEQIYQRQSELMKVNGISQNDYEQTGLQINSLKADIDVQKVLIRKTEVLAPFDGTIGLRNISVGAQVSPTTLLATIRKEDQLKLDFSVPEKYSPFIQPGMVVKFSMYNDEHLYGASVMATEGGITSDTRSLKVRAVVNDHSKGLIPGSYANVLLRLSENHHALVIPTQAIIPQEENKLVIVARSGKVHYTQVKTGLRKASGIEVTEGIQPGDTIITSGVLFLKEGTRLLYATVKTDSI